MNQMPASVRPALRRLGRRLAVGLFLDVWPPWAAAALVLAGLVAVVCRMFFPAAASALRWLWLVPILTTLPALAICVRRAYRPADVVAVADSLTGGQGVLLTLFERNDPAWAESVLVEQASRWRLPRLRPWRRLASVPPALAFLALAMFMPQRISPLGASTVLADDIAADLNATVLELKQQALITPDEEQNLVEEIERIRRAAQERADSSSFEAADTLRERVAAGLSEKQDALKWASESLARYAAAAQGGAATASDAEAASAELTKALETLARSGLLAGAPADLQRLLAAARRSGNAGALRELAASLSEYLGDQQGRFSNLGKLGKEFGRFDPSEFPLDSDGSAPDGDGSPGRGGINRGRGDADLTWGKESLPLDRFKVEALPPGAARSPDDWAPLVVLPGAPQESPELSTRSPARQYAANAGQTAWRRTLAPRHRSAVKKYFEK
jgi:hypothetical protein